MPAGGLDLGLVANAVPRLTPLIVTLQQLVAEKKGAIRAAADARKTSIKASTAERRTAVQDAVIAFERRLTASIRDAHSQLKTVVGEHRGAAKTAAKNQKGQSDRALDGEASRVGSEGEQSQSSVRKAAATKNDLAQTVERTQSERVTGEVKRQAAEARKKGEVKASGFHDSDPDRAKAQGDAVLKVAEQQAVEIEKTAPEQLGTVRKLASTLTKGFAEQANQVAHGIQEAIPGTQDAIRKLKTTASQHLTVGASTTVQQFDRLESELGHQLDDLMTAGLTQSKNLKAEVLPSIDDTERANLDQVDSVARDGEEQLDAAAARALIRGEGAEGPLQEIEQKAAQAFKALGTDADERVEKLRAQALSGLKGIEDQTKAGIAGVLKTAASSTESLKTKALEGLQLTAREAFTHAKEIADSAIKKFKESAEKAIAEFDSAFTKSRENLEKSVADGLGHNDVVLAQLDGNMTTAASKAATEYDSAWWQRGLLALGKALLFLAISIAVIYILAAAIFLIAGAAITFGTALLIAVIVVAVAAVIFEFYQRLVAYKAEHGPVDSIWKALGISAVLLLISIGTLTGIPQIIEGARGKRFFSDIPLSSQERYDLVIGGTLQFLVLLLGLRSALKAGPRAEPSRIGRLNEAIGRWLEGLIRKGKPPEIKPPEVKPPDVKPPVVVEEPYDALGKRFGLSPEAVARLRATGTDPAIVDRLLSSGMDPGEVAGLAEKLGAARLKEFVDKLGADRVKAISQRYGANAMDRLGPDVLRDIGPSMDRLVEAGIDPKDVVALTEKLGAARLKEFVDKLGADRVKAINQRYGADAMDRLGPDVLRDIGPSMDKLVDAGMDPKDVVELTEKLGGARLKEFVDKLGAQKVKELHGRFKPAAMDHYGPDFFKDYQGVTDTTMDHLQNFDGVEKQAIKGTHDRAVFLRELSTRGQVLSENPGPRPDVSEIEYKLFQRNPDGSLKQPQQLSTGKPKIKTVIKDLAANRDVWKKLGNEAADDAINNQSLNQAGGGTPGSAKDGTKLFLIFRPPQIDTFFPDF